MAVAAAVTVAVLVVLLVLGLRGAPRTPKRFRTTGPHGVAEAESVLDTDGESE